MAPCPQRGAGLFFPFMELAYSLQGVSKKYTLADIQAIDDISLDIPAGEAVGVIGPNGAGKTTLVRLMMGLLKADSGRITLFGRDIGADSRAVAEHVAYLPQQGFGRAMIGLTVQEAVIGIGRLRGLSRSAACDQASRWLERLALSEIAEKPLHDLSGGQKRLAALACILIGGRRILILDEPTNDLDPESRRRVWRILQDLRNGGATIIVNTHNILEAENLMERVIWLSGGRLRACEPAAQLRSRLESLSVELWSSAPLPVGFAAGIGSVVERSSDGRRVRLACRPTEIGALTVILQAPGPASRVHWTVRTPTLEDVYLDFHQNETSR